MIENKLKISVHERYLNVRDFRQPLSSESLFFVYRWNYCTNTYLLYTEQELRYIHKRFGNPSVRAARKLLQKIKRRKARKGRKEVTDEDTRCVPYMSDVQTITQKIQAYHRIR